MYQQRVLRGGAIVMAICTLIVSAVAETVVAEEALVFTARRQVPVRPGSTEFRVVHEEVRWDPTRTAVVICDMWDKHWCQGATRRVAEMAPRMNETVAELRRRGVLVIHAPSDTMNFYADTPQRRRAQAAQKVDTAIPLRGWCSLDTEREAPLPIDDSDGGCDCEPKCRQGRAWSRQIPTIEIHDADAITDDAHAYYLMKERGIENVIVMGVHTNMCVLGRPFSIRQMIYQGQNVVLMRDLTDTMYNSRRKPFVPHAAGTDLVIEHIERYWCPSTTSHFFTDKPAHRFADDKRPHVVFITAEDEYRSHVTLPRFAQRLRDEQHVKVTVLHGDTKDRHNILGMDEIATADVVVLYVRRRALPARQMAYLRAHLEQGKPLVALRTTSHAFAPLDNPPSELARWSEFDGQVLGGNYTGHHGAGPIATVVKAEATRNDPLLKDVPDTFQSKGSLYIVSPLKEGTRVLLTASVPGKDPQPVAWTHRYGRSNVFYTSLGHPDDFDNPAFQSLLRNAIDWACDRK